MSKPFKSSIKVYFVDTDAAGVAHHSSYIKWLEQGRIDFLDHIGYPYELMQNDKKGFSPVHIDIKYKKPLRFGDTVTLETQLLKQQKASFSIESHFILNKEVVCSATVKLACLDEEKWSIMPLPKPFIQAVKQFEGE